MEAFLSMDINLYHLKLLWEKHRRIQAVSTAVKIMESSHNLGWKRPLGSLSPTIYTALAHVPPLLIGTSRSFSNGEFSRYKDIKK